MTQDAEYKRNQSRYLHAMYRRNRRGLKILLFIWCIIFGGRLVLATLSLVVDLGLGLAASDVRESAFFVGFAGAFWLFAKLIDTILSAFVRRVYGPDPAEEQC